LRSRGDTLQIKKRFSDVQYMLGFEASKESPECTSLEFFFSKRQFQGGRIRERDDKCLPADSPDPVCSFSTA
jgi:hypothetical protein